VGCRFDCLGIRWYKQDPTVTFNRCATDSGAATNAFSNYNWQLIPVGSTSVVPVGGRVSVMPDFKLLPDAAYKIIDVRGRIVAFYNGRELSGSSQFKPNAQGLYFVVDGKNRLAQKVLVK
jgi:hypothetical protein